MKKRIIGDVEFCFFTLSKILFCLFTCFPNLQCSPKQVCAEDDVISTIVPLAFSP